MHHPVLRDPAKALKLLTFHDNVEVALSTILKSCVATMGLTIIDNLKNPRRERLIQRRFNFLSSSFSWPRHHFTPVRPSPQPPKH